ncbi:MAG: family channel protein [Gemmatimonadetes bacterium]|nr:family channel protein [Gemmatimonadota bacterium]
MHDSPARPMVAEAIGTFTLCFIGILAITVGRLTDAPAGTVSLASIALAHGLAIAVMVAALGAVSGGHFNPAVTFGFVVTGRMTPLRGLLYWVAQLVGAFVAGAILVGIFGAKTVADGTPALTEGLPMGPAILLEAVVTFFLVLVVFGTAVDERAPKSVYPFAIGLTVALDIMAVGPLTGGAMNPARAFGPALASGAWANQLVYWIGPLLGGAAAALLQHYFLLVRAPSVATAEHGGPAPEEQRRAH